MRGIEDIQGGLHLWERNLRKLTCTRTQSEATKVYDFVADQWKATSHDEFESLKEDHATHLE